MREIETKKLSAKTLLRALLYSAFIVWIIAYTYAFSSKSSPSVYNYAQILQANGEKISKEIAIAAKSNPYSEQLISLCCSLCEVKLCQKDSALTKDDLPALLKIADCNINNHGRSDLNIFIGNICRECGNYDQAKVRYQKSISLLNNQSVDTAFGIGQLDSQIIKARNLNNLGVLHYLQGKTATSTKDKSINYLLAKDYFVQANTIMLTHENICLSKTIQNNIQQCLWELKFIN